MPKNTKQSSSSIIPTITIPKSILKQFEMLKAELSGVEADPRSVKLPYLKRMKCLCPIHERDGSNPSLAIDIKLVGEDASQGVRLVWYCFGGCKKKEVSAALLEILKGEKGSERSSSNESGKESSRTGGKTNKKKEKLKQLIAENKAYRKTLGEWVYRDITGKPLYTKKKYVVILRETGEVLHKDWGKYRVTNVRGMNDFDTEAGNVGRGGLYGLERMIKAQRLGYPICIAEGEKDADTVYKSSKIACVSGGNGAGEEWSVSDALTVLGSYLTDDEIAELGSRAKTIFILQDDDSPGLQGAISRALLLHEVKEQFGIKASIRIVPPFPRPEGSEKNGWDVSDWFDGYPGAGRETFLDMLRNAKEFDPTDLDDPDEWLSIRGRVEKEILGKSPQKAVESADESWAEAESISGGNSGVICSEEFSWLLKGIETRNTNHFYDGDLAEFLLRDYASVLRYVPETKTWIRYAPERGIWVGEEDTAAYECLWDMSRRMLAWTKTFRAYSDDDVEIKAARIEAGSKLKKLKVLKDVIGGAKNMTQFHIGLARLDANSELLPVKNGVIDLRSGELLEHSPRYYWSKQLDVWLEESSHCPTWEKFVADTFTIRGEDGSIQEESSREYREFVKRLWGYQFTGLVTEQIYTLYWGRGSNGKSVFVNMQLKLAGDFGTCIRVENILKGPKQQGNEATPELAKLGGMRLVSAGETPENCSFNDSLLKDLVSGDPISVRAMYGKPFKMRNASKLIVRGNSLPRIAANDTGMLRRLIPLPFYNQIDATNIDHNLEKKLEAELPGILRWTVEGAKDWFENGLGVPDVCKNFLAEYRAELDLLQEFIEEVCEVGTGIEVERGEFYRAYNLWVLNRGEKSPDRRGLSMEMRRKGYVSDMERKKRVGGRVVRSYSGIKLTSEGLRRVFEESDDIITGMVDQLED